MTVRAIKRDDWLDLFLLAGPARVPRSMTRRLLADRDGLPVAAIALSSGTVVAEPADPPPDAIRTLELLRYRVVRQAGQNRLERSLLRRARARVPAGGDPPVSAGRSTRPVTESVAGPSG